MFSTICFEIFYYPGKPFADYLTIKRNQSCGEIQKKTGESFCTNIGVPQGDALSPRLFNFYLQMALNEENLGRKVPVEHDYTIPASTNLLPHVEYADDVDFISKPNKNSEDLLTLVETSFAKYQLRLNTDKTLLEKQGKTRVQQSHLFFTNGRVLVDRYFIATVVKFYK